MFLLAIVAMATYVAAYPHQGETKMDAFLSDLKVKPVSYIDNAVMILTHTVLRVPEPCKAFLHVLHFLFVFLTTNFGTALVRIIASNRTVLYYFLIVGGQQCLRRQNIPPPCGSAGGFFCYYVQWIISTGDIHSFRFCPIGELAWVDEV